MQRFDVVLLVLVVMSATACVAIDFGESARTERTQIQANADVAVANAEKEAAIGVAVAEASKSQAWAMSMPLIVGIIGVCLIMLCVVWWQGKIYHTRAVQGQSSQLLTIQSEQDLKLYARQLGGRLAIDDQGYKVYLPGGQVQRLLPVQVD